MSVPVPDRQVSGVSGMCNERDSRCGSSSRARSATHCTAIPRFRKRPFSVSWARERQSSVELWQRSFAPGPLRPTSVAGLSRVRALDSGESSYGRVHVDTPPYICEPADRRRWKRARAPRRRNPDWGGPVDVRPPHQSTSPQPCR